MLSVKTITRIEVQKRNPKRRSLYVDDVFVGGVDEEVVHRLGLRSGQPVDDATLEHVLLQEERRRVREAAYRYLGRRAHSEQELRTKLSRRGFPVALIDEVLAQLRDRGYVDDLEFARAYVRNQMATNPMGPTALRAALLKKGVDREIADRVVQETLAETDELELATQIARSRASRYAHLAPQKARERLGALLARRGFSYEVITEILQAARVGREPVEP